MTSTMRSCSTASRRMMDVARIMSEQEVALSHGKDRGGFADKQLTIGTNVVGFGIDLDQGCRIVVHHVLLADSVADVLDGNESLLDTELRRQPILHRSLRYESE